MSGVLCLFSFCIHVHLMNIPNSPSSRCWLSRSNKRDRFLTHVHAPCPPIDSILKLMAIWRITRKIIRTTIIVNYVCTREKEFLQFYF